MGFDVRTVQKSDLRAWYTTLSSAFYGTTDPQAIADFRAPQLDMARTWAAYDGDRIVATLRSYGTELTVPGGATLPADAVTGVTTMPSHRRRGALTSMMTASLQTAVERGDPLSILIAARWPIYGRYGYGPATHLAGYSVDTGITDFGALGHEGVVEYVDAATGHALMPALFDRFRRAQPGAISRDYVDFDREFGIAEVPSRKAWVGWVVVHRPAPNAEIDGLLRYHVDESWEGMRPFSVAVIDDLVSTNTDAYAALWKLCCDLDNIATLSAENRSVEELLPWMLADARAVVQTKRFDNIWVRILDVEVALSSRRYLTAGSLVIEVRDTMNHAAGRYLLEAGPDDASCTRTTKDPDIELDVRTLGAAYLGGTSLQTMATAGLVVERRAGAITLADTMFRWTTVPWCNTWF